VLTTQHSLSAKVGTNFCYASENNYCATVSFQAEMRSGTFIVCSMYGSEPERSQLLSAVLRRMQCGTSAAPALQKVEALCEDMSLTPGIRLQALELLQVQKIIFKLLLVL
jgi:hypothetical protein